MRHTISYSVEETMAAGKDFASSLVPGSVVAVRGTLGSGKTCFVSGVCDGLGVSVRVTSPTFTIINEYPSPVATVAHIDMYRIRDYREVTELGLEEYFCDRYISLIEWPEKVVDLLPPSHFEIVMEHGLGPEQREIFIEKAGEPAR
jgi:tRNA threonylcarbamoyladenosine biosynthesis protein TsaE